MNDKSLSFWVLCHDEGNLLYRTFQYVERAIRNSSIAIELNFFLDSADELTKNVVDKIADKYKCEIYSGEFEDPGASRNKISKMSNNNNMCILDGDDIIGENVISKWVNQKKTKNVFFHPEFIWYLKPNPQLHIQENLKSNIIHSFYRNPFVSFQIAQTNYFKNIKYVSNKVIQDSGFEDWGHIINSLELGYTHQVLRNTSYFVRVKEFSRLTNDIMLNRKVYPFGDDRL
jgi:hypothetical protein